MVLLTQRQFPPPPRGGEVARGRWRLRTICAPSARLPAPLPVSLCGQRRRPQSQVPSATAATATPPATSSAKRSPGESGRSDRGGARGAGAGRRSDQGTGLTWGVQHLGEVGWRPTCRVETCITRCSPWSPASCTLQSRVPRPGWGLGVPGAAMLCVPGRRSL